MDFRIHPKNVLTRPVVTTFFAIVQGLHILSMPSATWHSIAVFYSLLIAAFCSAEQFTSTFDFNDIFARFIIIVSFPHLTSDRRTDITDKVRHAHVVLTVARIRE